MSTESNDQFIEDGELLPNSKTQTKKEMTALQELGVALSKFKESQLRSLPLNDKLIDAILETKRISHKNALKRHNQFIGKLMREVDEEALREALEQMENQSLRSAKLKPYIESWVDTLIDDPTKLSVFISQHPSTDVQHLRNVLRQAKKETDLARTTEANGNQGTTIKVQRQKLFKTIQAFVTG